MENCVNPVLVVGARTTGLTMACELARHDVPVRVIDKSPGIDPHCRANLLHSRSLEVFQDLGIIDELLDLGHLLKGGWQYANGTPFNHIHYGDVESPYPCGLALGQNHTERVLENLLNRLGFRVERNTELVDFVLEPDAVRATLRLADGSEETVYTPWLLGCDGAHSRVRHINGLNFSGEEDIHQYVLADVAVEAPLSEDEWHGFLTDYGSLYFFIHAPGRRLIVADIAEHHNSESEQPTLDEICSLVEQRAFPNARISDPHWLAYFRIQYRLASHYRKGRSFMAGDAVHVHSLIGGQGMNTGIQDAYNLAWKLALVIHGKASESLLDSYERERRQIGEEILRSTKIFTERDEVFAHLSPPEREKLYFNVFIPETQRLCQLHHFEELDLDYRNSPICMDAAPALDKDTGVQSNVHPGAEARDAGPLYLEGRQCTLFELLRGIPHTALLFAATENSDQVGNSLLDLAIGITARFGDLVNVFVIVKNRGKNENIRAGAKLVADPDYALHDRYNASAPCLYLIRPDGHVAFRDSSPTLNSFQQYIRHVFVEPLAGNH